MYKAVKVRIYPNPNQVELLAKSFGSCRWFWNYLLATAKEQYDSSGKTFNIYECKKSLPLLKKQVETAWLKEPPSQCLQAVSLHLGKAFERFFKKQSGFPKFKSKHGKQSLTFPQGFKIFGDRIQFPKLGLVLAKIHRPITGKVKSITLSKNSDGNYFASILVEDGLEKPEISTEGKAIGLDVGLNHFVTDSDGNKIDNPRWFKKHERNLKIKQQRLSRRKKDSRNRNKARLAVARTHSKISRCRADFHHKLSRKITNENQVIAVENLNIKGMVKNRKLAKAISQVGWGQFCTMLKYKAENEGKLYVEVDRFYASSKTCNFCLNKVDSLPLDIRAWTCNSCNNQHDRDVNAARNIRDEALRNIASGTGVKAFRLELSPNTSNSNRRSFGQEASHCNL